MKRPDPMCRTRHGRRHTVIVRATILLERVRGGAQVPLTDPRVPRRKERSPRPPLATIQRSREDMGVETGQ